MTVLSRYLAQWVRVVMGLVMIGPVLGVPGVLPHQGRVQVNGVNFGSPVPATGHFKFAFIDPSAGTTLWTNDGSNTGTPGGEPVGAVAVEVNKGLYALGLGDTTLPNMTGGVPAGIFQNRDDVRLRIWFSDDGAAFEQLAPDLRVMGNAYALVAGGLKQPAGAVNGYVLKTDANGVGTWQPDQIGTNTDLLASLSGTVGQTVVYNGTGWTMVDLPGYDWSGALGTTPFRVEIGGQAIPQEHWTGFSGGGVDLKYMSQIIGGDGNLELQMQFYTLGMIELTGPLQPESLGGAGAITTSDFEVDELYGVDTLRVEGLEARWPVQEVSGPPGSLQRVYAPTAPIYEDVTITGRGGTAYSSSVKSWVRANIEGSTSYRTITINIRKGPREAPIATFILHDCLPVAFKSMGTRVGVNGFEELESVTIRPDRIEMTAHVKTPIQQWYADLMGGGTSSAMLRTFQLTFLDQLGQDHKVVNYTDCFITSYSLPPLVKGSEQMGKVELLEEKLIIQPGYSSDVLE